MTLSMAVMKMKKVPEEGIPWVYWANLLMDFALQSLNLCLKKKILNWEAAVDIGVHAAM